MKITLPQRSGSLLELVVRGSDSVMANTVIASTQTNAKALFRSVILAECVFRSSKQAFCGG